MNTDELIADMSRTVRPVRRHAVAMRIAVGMALGGVGTVLLILAWLGINPDLGLAMRGYAFWMKWIYTISLALCAVAATIHLARPDSGKMGWLWIMAVPALLLAVIGLIEMAHAPSTQWLPMWLGVSWKSCSASVFLLSIPIFAGLLWSFRQLAPTRLRLAGATAGLAAGAWAATLYCLHCPEVSAIFVLTWYSLGIGLTALLGSAIGPRLLRW